MQLELFKNETFSEYYNIDKIDVVDIYDPARQCYPLLNQIQRGDYFLYKTGYTHPALYLYGNIFPSLYSNLSKKFLQPHIRKDEYVHFGFYCSVTKKTYYHLIHRLVGCAFIVNDNPSVKKLINHKNNQNHDFRISNLEWASYKENTSSENVNKGNRALIKDKLRERHEREMKENEDA
tara:strand:- start:710 stop:1243 length:534 start_codon:yes stop_codon:yes gene_type:complete